MTSSLSRRPPKHLPVVHGVGHEVFWIAVDHLTGAFPPSLCLRRFLAFSRAQLKLTLPKSAGSTTGSVAKFEVAATSDDFRDYRDARRACIRTRRRLKCWLFWKLQGVTRVSPLSGTSQRAHLHKLLKVTRCRRS